MKTLEVFFFYIINILFNYKLQNTTKTNYQATTNARQRTKSQIPYALQFDELHQDE